MPGDSLRQMWSQILTDGTPHEIISFAWVRLTENGVLSAFFLMLWTLAFRFALISFYFSLMYFAIAYIKSRLNKKMSVRANYNCWYLLLFSFVLANLPFNNSIMALLIRLISPTGSQVYLPYVFIVISLFSVVWLISVVNKLARLMRMDSKIKKSMKRMKRFDDDAHLATLAAQALGLRRVPEILIAEYIETPVSYGFFKKTVLLPVSYKEKYSDAELYLLLLHEMTHIKHGDTVKLYLVSIIECFLWLSPAMRSFVKSFKRDSEVLCDNRVVGLQASERDAYGNLILKECAYKTARFGFGFSDSYQAIENRLDALYRYKADKNLKLLAIIPIAVLAICASVYAFRADLIVVSDDYNTSFDLHVLDQTSGEYMPLPPEAYFNAFEIKENILYYDDDAIIEHLSQYAVDGTISLKMVTNNYNVQGGENGFSQSHSGYHDSKASNPGELEIVFESVTVLKERTLVEYLFLKIASML